MPEAVTALVDPATHTLYVAGETTGRIDVFDARSCNARRLHCRPARASIPTGRGAFGWAIDAKTHTIYLALFESQAVQVIDGQSCNARVVAGCSAAPTYLKVANHPVGLAIDPRTRTVYVGTAEEHVLLVDAAACNGGLPAGCSAPVASIATLPGPGFPLVDQGTDTLYVPNGGNDEVQGNTLSLIDLRLCNAHRTSGCGRAPVTTRTGPAPYFALVDAHTDTIYVSNLDDRSLSVIDRSTCNARNTTGCGSDLPPSVQVGPNPQNLALSRKTHTVYVLSDSDTIAAVDIRRCNAHDLSACAAPPRTLQTGARPLWMQLDPTTDTIYVADRVDEVVQVLDARSCNAFRSYGCRHEAPAVAGGDGGGSMDPVHHTLFQPLQAQHSIGFIDTATCNTTRRTGCRTPLVTVVIGEAPGNMAIDVENHTLYIGDSALGVLQVIDTNTCNVSRQDGCSPVVSIPLSPAGLPNLNTQTHTVYITQYSEDTVAVLHGTHCNASDQSDCGVFSVSAGDGPNVPWVDVATNTVYITDVAGDGNKLAVLNGAACDAGSAGCHLLATTDVGFIPFGMASDATTHSLYVGIWAFGDEPGSVAILDTHRCGAANISGCGTAWPRVAAGHGTFGVTYEPSAHRIYTTNASSATISVISTRGCNALTTRGCRSVSPRIAVGYFSTVSYIDPLRHTLYVENADSRTASLIDIRHPCRPNLCFR